MIECDAGAVNPDGCGTKGAARYPLSIGAGQTITVRLRFNETAPGAGDSFDERFEQTFEARRREADEFYAGVLPAT